MRKHGFGWIGRRHLAEVADLLQRADERLNDAEHHIRNRDCAPAITNVALAHGLVSRAYENYEAANKTGWDDPKYTQAAARLSRVTKEITERCIERSRCGEVSLRGLRRRGR